MNLSGLDPATSLHEPNVKEKCIAMKKLLSFVLVIALVVLIPAVAAQEGDPACFNLSAEDCAVLTAASANTDTISSFTQTFFIDFDLSGLSMLTGGPEDSITAQISGSGPFVLGVAGDVPFALRLDMDVAFDDGMDSITASIPFAIVDGILYIPGEDEIVGIPLNEETLAMLDFDDLTGGMLPLEAEDLLGGGDMMAPPATLGDLFGFDGAAMEVDEFVLRYTDYQRLSDVMLLGQTMYPFALTLDLTGMIRSPEVQELVNELLGVADMFADDEMMADPMLGMMMGLVPMLLEGIEGQLVVTQYVGADNNFINKLTVDLDLALDLGLLFGMGEPQEGMPEFPPITVDLTFDVELTDINEDLVVTAPAGARILTPEEIEMMSMGMGGF